MNAELHQKRQSELESIRSDDHHALRICLCGKFNAGKTSLLNLLLNISLPVLPVTTTGTLTRVVYGDGCALRTPDGELQALSPESLKHAVIVREKGMDNVTVSGASCAYFATKSQLLRRGKVEFWDTPGMEDDEVLTYISLSASKKCDVIIYVLHANQALSLFEKRHFPLFHRQTGGNLLFVVNHTDQLRQDEREQLFPVMKSLSARYACPALQQGNLFFTSANPDCPDINTLRQAIQSLFSTRGERLQLLTAAAAGRADVLSGRWEDELALDQEDETQKENALIQNIQADVTRQKNELEQQYDRCQNAMKKTVASMTADLNSESRWRDELLRYQSISGWELHFRERAEALMKERMERILREGRESLVNATNGTVFAPDVPSFSLDRKRVWKRVNWYRNFYRPLFFANAHFQRYKTDCVNICTQSVMTNAVPMVSSIVSSAKQNMQFALNVRYQRSMDAIVPQQNLTNELQRVQDNLSTLQRYREEILTAKAEIADGTIRKSFLFWLRDVFSFLFPSLLSREMYDYREY